MVRMQYGTGAEGISRSGCRDLVGELGEWDLAPRCGTRARVYGGMCGPYSHGIKSMSVVVCSGTERRVQ